MLTTKEEPRNESFLMSLRCARGKWTRRPGNASSITKGSSSMLSSKKYNRGFRKSYKRRGTLDGAKELMRKNLQNSGMSRLQHHCWRYRTNMRFQGPQKACRREFNLPASELVSAIHIPTAFPPQQVLPTLPTSSNNSS